MEWGALGECAQQHLTSPAKMHPNMLLQVNSYDDEWQKGECTLQALL